VGVTDGLVVVFTGTTVEVVGGLAVVDAGEPVPGLLHAVTANVSAAAAAMSKVLVCMVVFLGKRALEVERDGREWSAS
jgi:hypothetical protein